MSHTVRLNVLTEDEIQQIHQATLEVLERTGVKVICDEALELLRDAGCEVDGDIVHIPPQLVEEAIDVLRARKPRPTLCMTPPHILGC